eukprot:scaffold434150_cov20-Prasinocladus_malaysianus.AAC.1
MASWSGHADLAILHACQALNLMAVLWSIRYGLIWTEGLHHFDAGCRAWPISHVKVPWSRRCC